jgi:outer membrane protein assembly factor BamB
VEAADEDGVFSGSFDGKVYALDAGIGEKQWTDDTRSHVCSERQQRKFHSKTA